MSIKNIAHESFIKVIKFYNSEKEKFNINAQKLNKNDNNFCNNVSFMNGQLDILSKLYKIINEAKKQTELI